MVVGEPRYDVRHEFSHTILKAVNITSGATRTMPDLAALRASDWLFDVQGRPRVARQSVEGDVVTWWADDKGVWKELVKAPRFQAPYEPAYVDGNDGLVVRTAAADGSLVLRRFDFSTGKPVSEAIVSTPGFSGGLSPVRLPGSGPVVGQTDPPSTPRPPCGSRRRCGNCRTRSTRSSPAG